MKKFLKVVAVSFFAFLLIACGGKANDLPKNEAGLSLEDLAPYDSNFAVTYGAYDAVQRENFFNLLGKFGLSGLWDKYMLTLENMLAESSLSFEEDFKPMLGENYRALVAFEIGDVDGNSDEGAEDYVELYDSDYVGELVMALTVVDTVKAAEFLNALASAEGMVIGDKEGFLTVTDTANGAHYALLGNFIVMTLTDDAMANVIARYKEGADSLADNENYLNAFAAFEEPQIAYVYFTFWDVESFVGMEDTAQLNAFKMINYGVYGVGFREDGLSFQGFTQFDKKEMKKYGSDLSMFSGPGVYMVDSLNGDGLVGYAESYNVAHALRSNPIFALPEVKDGFRALFGTDIDDGLFSWMDKGMAVMWQDSGSIFPGLSFVFDASSAAASAKDFYLKLDGQFSTYIALMEAETPGSLKKDVFGNLTVLTFDFAKLDSTGELRGEFAGLLPTSTEFTYGLTDDDFFVISIQNGFQANYGKNVVSDGAKYKEAMGQIGNLEGGFAYFDFSTLDEYVGQVAELALRQQLQQTAIRNQILGLSEEESKTSLESEEGSFRAMMQQVVDVLQKIDFIAVGSELVSDDYMKTAGYLKLK